MSPQIIVNNPGTAGLIAGGSVRPTVGAPAIGYPVGVNTGPVMINGVAWVDEEGDWAADTTSSANLVTLYKFTASAWSAGVSLIVNDSNVEVNSLGVNVTPSGTVGRIDASVIVAQSKSGAIGSIFAGNGSVGGGGIWGGSGAPATGLGAVGDFYFRTDTPSTSLQRIYTKTASAVWTGIV